MPELIPGATPIELPPVPIGEVGDEFHEQSVDPNMLHEQEWFVSRRVRTRIMHAIHGNTLTRMTTTPDEKSVKKSSKRQHDDNGNR